MNVGAQPQGGHGRFSWRNQQTRGWLNLIGGIVVIVALFATIVVTYDRGQPPPDPDQLPPAAQETDPSPVDGAPRRALDLAWTTECAWHDALQPAADAPQLMRFYLDMEPADVDELYDRSPRSNVRLPGTYRLSDDGPAVGLGEKSVRFRGRSARNLPKQSFNIRLEDRLPSLDTERLNLNAMYTDPAMVREHLSMTSFAQSGLPAPRTAYVDFYLNDVFEGLYVYMQRVDEQLLAEHGIATTDVTLVRDRSRDRIDDTDSKGEPRSVFDPDATTPLDTGTLAEVFDARGEPDLDAVASLVGWVRNAEPDAAFVEELHRRFDVDQLIDFLAWHTLLGDSDAYYDDFWLYKPADVEQFGIIPWDKDLTFGSHFSQSVANLQFSYESPVDRWVTRRNRLFDLVMTTPQLRTRHDDRVREFSREFDVAARCRQLAALLPVIEDSATTPPGPDAFVRHEANNVAGGAEFNLHVAAILDYVQLRQRYLDVQLFGADSNPGQVRVTAEDAGSTVLFTQANGWSMARLDVFEVDTPGTIDVSVVPADDEADVDRHWQIDAGDARVRGQLSLYYRNDNSRGDWVQAAATDDPVAGQHDFAVVDVADDRPLLSAVNPYANRVSTDVELAGARTLAVRRMEDSAVADLAQAPANEEAP